jgi:uncharacterized protein involved in exopolysaccharide biosynthesis
MSLPERQQQVLDQIERALQAADPGLRSMFAAFGRLASRADSPAAEAMPAAEAIPGRRVLWKVVIFLVVVSSLLGLVTIGVVATARACPGLSSDQVIASAAVRYAACDKATAAWSKGGR